MSIYGIDIGNNSTKISKLNNGIIEINLNNKSERNTKTFISFKDVRYYGEDAYNQLATNTNNVCYNFKNHLIDKKIKYKINYNKNNFDLFSEDLMYLFLSYIYKTLDKPEVTFAVPFNFYQSQKEIIKLCAKEIGYQQYNIINSHLH